MSHLNIPSTHRGLDLYPDGQDGAESYEITVRFSASLSDLPLSIKSADHPTTASLKQHIRASLPDDLKNKRIRLIHAGKALDDATPLSTSLKRLVSRPPSRVPTPGPYDSGVETDTSQAARSKSKGKTPVRDLPNVPQQRIYIHCSIGDVTLSEADLAAEAALATTNKKTRTQEGQDQDEKKEATSTTTPAPRGFDRLLTAGFTPAEVQSLRLQFMSIQAHTHTPDTMPSPTTLRAFEDQWLDNSNAAGGDANGLDLDGGGALRAGDEDGRGALDDMIWGTTMGFFWPIGCLIWGTRETGIFSPRRKIAIVIGVVLNLGLGFVRWGG